MEEAIKVKLDAFFADLVTNIWLKELSCPTLASHAPHFFYQITQIQSRPSDSSPRARDARRQLDFQLTSSSGEQQQVLPRTPSSLWFPGGMRKVPAGNQNSLCPRVCLRPPQSESGSCLTCRHHLIARVGSREPRGKTRWCLSQARSRLRPWATFWFLT